MDDRTGEIDELSKTDGQWIFRLQARHMTQSDWSCIQGLIDTKELQEGQRGFQIC